MVVKEAFAGSPKHIYKNLPDAETRSGGKIGIYSIHKPYVRFDWRLPHPDDDMLMPEGLADYFINTSQAKVTALKTFRLVKKFLNRHDLDITDICLFLNKDGNKILTEISPDNMGSLSYIGSIPEYKLIFAQLSALLAVLQKRLSARPRALLKTDQPVFRHINCNFHLFSAEYIPQPPLVLSGIIILILSYVNSFYDIYPFTDMHFS